MVEAAIALMADKGLSKFRFEELAEKVGCNRATIYRYFDSKQDLVTEVMMALMHQATSEIIDKMAALKWPLNRPLRIRFTESSPI